MNEFEIEFDIKPNEFEIEMENIVQEIYPELEDLEVTPSAAQQNFRSEKYGFNNVIVKAIDIKLQEKTITPTLEEQTINADDGYDGLSKVNVEAIETEELNIVPSKEQQNFKGLYGNVKVDRVTPDIDENIKAENIKAGINILGVDGGYEGIDTSDATATAGDMLKDTTAYVNNQKITGTIEKYDGTYEGNVSASEDEFKITNCAYLFYYSARTKQVNEVLKHCKDFENANYMFSNCTSLLSEDIDFTLLDFSSIKNLQYTFDKCSKLETIDLSHFKNNEVTILYYTFRNCSALKKLDLSGFDMEKLVNMIYPFESCTNLTDLIGFKNLGKGYTKQENNYSSYTLRLNPCTKLTHESLMNVINNLYDLNLTYDVANGGTLYRQSLVLGATNLAKLTEEEIAIATNKGWDVS